MFSSTDLFLKFESNFKIMDNQPFLMQLSKDIQRRGFDIKRVSSEREIDSSKLLYVFNNVGVFLETNKHLIDHGKYDDRYFDVRIKSLDGLDEPMLWSHYDSQNPSHIKKLSNLLEIDIATRVLWPIENNKRFKDSPISIFYNNDIILPPINQFLEKYGF